MNYLQNKRKIDQFWEWFSVHHNDLEEGYDNKKFIGELDEKVTDMGLVWEIGPGSNVKNQLVISPAGKPELLSYAKEIVSNSISISGWEFYHAKPPKKWGLMFEFEKENREIIKIDASTWHYVLLRYDDGMYEIILKPIGLFGLTENELSTIGEILIDGILGEEKRIMSVYAIDMVYNFEPQYISKVNDIKNLIKQIN